MEFDHRFFNLLIVGFNGYLINNWPVVGMNHEAKVNEKFKLNGIAGNGIPHEKSVPLKDTTIRRKLKLKLV